MFSRMRENLVYKLLALGFAIALHFYVIGQENPPQSRTTLVPLTVKGVPANLLFDDKSAPQISVTLTGPADIVNHLPDADITAAIDVSKAHAGRNEPALVHVILPPSVEGVSTEVQPSVVVLTLAQRAKHSFRITASDPGTPPAGFMFRPAKITPAKAEIAGSEEAVDSVKQVVANVDAGGSVGTIDNDFPVVALDAQGAQVTGITVTPATAHVHIAMTRVPAGKTLLVNYDLVGTPPFPYKVTSVDVTPGTVTVNGRPEDLAAISTVQTAPIDISHLTSDLTRQVALTLPPDVKTAGSNQVTVTVHVEAQATPAAPAAPTTGIVTPNEPKPQ